MNARIETHQIYTDKQHQAQAEEADQIPSNGELMTPANYAAVGGTFELLMLMLQVSKSEKADTRNQITVAEAGAAVAEQEQVDSIRAKATSALAASAVGFGLSAANLANTGSQIKAQGALESAKTTGNAQLITGASADLQRATLRTDLGAMQVKLSEGVGGSIQTSHEATAAEKQNQAGVLRRSAERLSSELDDLKGNEDKLISYARDIEAAKNRCTQIALQSR